MTPRYRTSIKRFRRGAPAGLAAVALLVGQSAFGAWAPQTDEWATIRGGTTHTGRSPLTSAFTPGQGGAARVKWTKTIPHPDYVFPPNVADLNRDGIPEVVVTGSDVKVQFGPPPTLSFNHRVHSLSGANGNELWFADEPTSFAAVNGANVADLDGDNNAEVLYFAGNPLTGTSSTNGLVARAGESGVQQWKFSDALNWRADQQAISILTAAHGANVDADPANEAVFVLNLANLVVTSSQPPDCDQPRIEVQASNIHSFVHALNGTATSASNAWFRHFDPGLIASTPMIADLNGDGRNEVLFGAGTPAGELISGCEVAVTLDNSAFDNRIVAINGASPPNSLWEFRLEDPVGTPRGPAAIPILAGNTAGGDPIVAMLVPVPESPAGAGNDYNVLIALNGRTGSELWRQTLASATIAPLAAADLDNDGQPELITQISSRLATFRNRTGADFWAQGAGPTRGIAYARSLSSAGVAVADLDSDGTQEIAAILDGDRRTNRPKAELIVVSGADGSVEWTTPIIQDDAVGGPVIADVDGDDDVAEIVVGAGSVTVTDSTTHMGTVIVFEPNIPDLTVAAVRHTGNRLTGSVQTIEADVTNLGSRDIAVAPFRLLHNGVPVGADQTIALAAGATGTVSFPWTPGSAGVQNLTVVADAASAVPELVETNNQRSTTVKILLPPNAPTIAAPAQNALLNTSTVNVSGTADSSATVKLYDMGNLVATTSANASGQWSVSQGFADGQHELTATGTDEAANVSPPSAVRTFRIDSQAPAAPVIDVPAQGEISNTNNVVVSGRAEALAVVRVFEGMSELGLANADGTGSWSMTRTFSDGPHSIQATATDAAGNTSLRSAARMFSVDTVALPPLITAPAEGAFLPSTAVTITGNAEPHAVVVVDEEGSPVGTVSADADGRWSVAGTFGAGLHKVTARQTDFVGNISDLSPVRSFTVDLTPPAAPEITTPSEGQAVNVNAVPVAGTSEAFATITLFKGTTSLGSTTADALGRWTRVTNFDKGIHKVHAVARDRAGHLGPASVEVTFEVTVSPPPPLLVQITSPANGTFHPRKVTVSGTADAGATKVLVYDGLIQVATAPVVGGRWTAEAELVNGIHSLTARGQGEGALGPSSNRRDITVDGAEPNLALLKPSGFLLFQVMLFEPAVRGLAEEIHAFDSGVDRFELTYENRFTGDIVLRTATCKGCGTRDASFADTPDLGFGYWTVEVRAYDKVGNVASKTMDLFSFGV